MAFTRCPTKGSSHRSNKPLASINRRSRRKRSGRFIGRVVLLFFTVSIFFLLYRQLSFFRRLHYEPSVPAFITPKQAISTTTATGIATRDGKKVSPEPIEVAYVISLIKCGDHQSTPEGLIDAAAILRHSVHKVSSRNPESGSKYSYKMYAIVHEQALKCSAPLKDLGYELIVKPRPVEQSDIRGKHLKEFVHRAWCCGHDEFVKLYAYTITDHPVVVHLDIDCMMVAHMDELFDAIVYDKDSKEGREARGRIALDIPGTPMPDRIDAFFTRDYQFVYPGKIPGYQAGFVVLRPDPTVLDEMVNVIKEGNYVEGNNNEAGWGGKGYGGFVGDMAMQGLGVYFYDVIRPGTGVEVNMCRYGHMAGDVRYNSQPSFNHRKRHLKGKCRNGREECEDCMKTDLSLVKSIHLTNCKKPWTCPEVKDPKLTVRQPKRIDIHNTEVDKCPTIHRIWNEYRRDFEDQLYEITKDGTILGQRNGSWKTDWFMGHCESEGKYNPIKISPDAMKEIHKIYD